VNPYTLSTESRRWIHHGLPSLILAAEDASSSFLNASHPPRTGRYFRYRIALGDFSDVLELQTAWRDRDDDRLGLLLGYPQCCRAFFSDTWGRSRLRDPIWSIALNTNDSTQSGRIVTIPHSSVLNLLWRYLGVRTVSHWPCSFSCHESEHLAELFSNFALNAGYVAEYQWLHEILNWPVEWSALHGIAEVKTPVLKFMTQTDATATTWTVRMEGTSYPAEGALGLRFPYRTQAKTPLTKSASFRRGLSNAALFDTLEANNDQEERP
jgi:hypothetical protein